ncbi:hypothetical protein DPMN_106519, partial [Dreissena polymorpha]
RLAKVDLQAGKYTYCSTIADAPKHSSSALQTGSAISGPSLQFVDRQRNERPQSAISWQTEKCVAPVCNQLTDREMSGPSLQLVERQRNELP